MRSHLDDLLIVALVLSVLSVLTIILAFTTDESTSNGAIALAIGASFTVTAAAWSAWRAGTAAMKLDLRFAIIHDHLDEMAADIVVNDVTSRLRRHE